MSYKNVEVLIPLDDFQDFVKKGKAVWASMPVGATTLSRGDRIHWYMGLYGGIAEIIEINHGERRCSVRRLS